MPNFLNKITFLDSSGSPQTVVGGSSFNIPDTNALRDSTGRFQVGNTDVSSTDPLVVINKNYADGRISAEATARENKDSSLEAAISAVDGSLTISSSFFNSLY